MENKKNQNQEQVDAVQLHFDSLCSMVDRLEDELVDDHRIKRDYCTKCE